MNIIEALQALKDGKKIRKTWWDKECYAYSEEGIVYNEGGQWWLPTKLDIDEENWELYTEHIRITPEERKALELAKACGFDTLRRNRYDDNGICVCVKNECDRYWYTEYAPSLSCLNDVSWMPEKGDLSIDDLLNGGEKRK